MRRVALPLATSLLFAGSFVAGKYTTLDLGPLTTSLLRYVVALAFLAALLALPPRLRGAAPAAALPGLAVAGRDLPAVLLLGLTGIVGYHYFFFSALRHTEVANTGVINALSPPVTALAAAWLLRERLPAAGYAGVATALAGVLLLLCDGDPAVLLGLRFELGDLLMLLAVLSWTVYAVTVRRLSDRYSSFSLTFHATLWGVLMLAPLTLLEAPLEQLAGISRASLLSVLYMGAGASGLGYLLYNLSIREAGPTRTASFVYSAVPVLVAGLAWLVFAEPVGAVTVASVVLILCGLRLLFAPGPLHCGPAHRQRSDPR